jgi:sulfate permease, SulP family
MEQPAPTLTERVHSWLPSSPWRLAPGLDDLRRYDRRRQLRPDLVAGLTVAAVAIPAGLGMGELAELSPVAGLYASLLPLAAYCLFGSSRDLDGYRDVAEHPDAASVPGLLVYRFDAPLYFANAAYFTARIQTLVAAADPKPRWVVFNAEAVTYIDATAIDALRTVRIGLGDAGIVFAVARAEAHLRRVFATSGYATELGEDRTFHSVRAAVDAYQRWEQP